MEINFKVILLLIFCVVGGVPIVATADSWECKVKLNAKGFYGWDEYLITADMAIDASSEVEAQTKALNNPGDHSLSEFAGEKGEMVYICAQGNEGEENGKQCAYNIADAASCKQPG